jgi:hypothetical protein
METETPRVAHQPPEDNFTGHKDAAPPPQRQQHHHTGGPHQSSYHHPAARTETTPPPPPSNKPSLNGPQICKQRHEVTHHSADPPLASQGMPLAPCGKSGGTQRPIPPTHDVGCHGRAPTTRSPRRRVPPTTQRCSTRPDDATRRAGRRARWMSPSATFMECRSGCADGDLWRRQGERERGRGGDDARVRALLESPLGVTRRPLLRIIVINHDNRQPQRELKEFSLF